MSELTFKQRAIKKLRSLPFGQRFEIMSTLADIRDLKSAERRRKRE